MIPLYTTQQIREADKFAIETLKIPSIVLMENASISIYNAITGYFQDLSKSYGVGFICGKGNNGGDGLAVARHFLNNGFNVKVLILADEEDLKGDVLTNFRILKNLSAENERCKIKNYQHQKDVDFLDDCMLVVDAMLGTGAAGELKEPYSTIVKKVNVKEYLRAAIDIPTGLQTEKGSGSVIFNADLTITLAELKSGLFYQDGYSHCGNIVKGSIGLSEDFFESYEVKHYLIEPEDAFYNLPERKKNAHKYSSGKVLIIAGSGKYPGAPSMTANSACKTGAGAVILCVPDSVKNVIHQKIDIAVVKSYDDRKNGFLGSENVDEITELLDWADSVVIGPGLGRESTTLSAVMEIVKKCAKKIIIDADACYAFADVKYKNINLECAVFTPHHKEFADMTGEKLADIENDILLYGSRFVKETGSMLVLKGAPTLIFTPGDEVLINSTGNSGMAKFGSGDVLTGVLGGFLSQNNNLEQTVISGVYIHSLCADLLTQEKTEYGYTAIDLINNLPKTLKFLNDTISQTLH